MEQSMTEKVIMELVVATAEMPEAWQRKQSGWPKKKLCRSRGNAPDLKGRYFEGP